MSPRFLFIILAPLYFLYRETRTALWPLLFFIEYDTPFSITRSNETSAATN